MWRVIGYRRLQALSVVLLAALVTACVVFAPLYERAMLQALTRSELDSAGVDATGLQVSATSGNSIGSPEVEAGSPAHLVSLVPASLRRSFTAAIQQRQAVVSVKPQSRRVQAERGPLVWRQGFCVHVEIMSGRCPTREGEIAISVADSRTLGLPVGSSATVPSEFEPDSGGGAASFRLRWWVPTANVRRLLVRCLSDGFSGKQDDPQSPVKHDVWLTPQSTFTSSSTPTLAQPRSLVEFPLDVSDTGVDELEDLSPALTRLSRKVLSNTTDGRVMTHSGLSAIADEVDHQGAQARVSVPLLTVQVALLALVALVLVLGAATEQRRPEVAVAMLRGRGRRGARALLLRELLPSALVGVPIGVGVALLLGWMARRVLLPGAVPFEFGLGPALVTLGAVLTVLVVVVLAVRRVCREPVERLLRRVPVRRSGWSLGALEAVGITAAATIVIAFFAGGLSGPIALAGPILLAVVVGLLLSHATTPVTAYVGRRLLARGWVGLGVSVLDAARNPATRRTIAVVTVASAVLVFSLSAVSVGSRNRELAAEQQAGAPMRLEVLGQDLTGVRAAVAAVDPTGQTLTPVVTTQPPGVGAAATKAVQPSAFAQIALFGDSSPINPSLLAPPRPHRPGSPVNGSEST